MADKLNIPGFKHYELDSVYQAKLAAGEVDAKDLSFVKETGKLYTQGGVYGGGGVEARILHASADGSALTEEQIAYNVETYNKMMAGGKIQLFLYNGPDAPLVPLAIDNVVEGIMVFNHPSFLVDTEINSLMFTLKSDGSTTFAQHTYPIGGNSVEAAILEVNSDGSALTAEQKANNVEIYNKLMRGDAIQVYLPTGSDYPLTTMFFESEFNTIITLRLPVSVSAYEIGLPLFFLYDDGSIEFNYRIIPIGSTIDTELSDTSENAVQNKAIKAYVDNAISSAITTTLNTAV